MFLGRTLTTCTCMLSHKNVKGTHSVMITVQSSTIVLFKGTVTVCQISIHCFIIVLQYNHVHVHVLPKNDYIFLCNIQEGYC